MPLAFGCVAAMELHNAKNVPKGKTCRESPCMTKASLHLLKGIGYLISTGSVILLAIVSWSSAAKSPVLTACLIGGAALSIVGMFCRWLTYQIEKRRQDN
jgi:hypothetical protein